MPRPKMTRKIKWGLAILFLGSAAYVAFPIFTPWSRLNCEYQDVDIKTGRLRFTHYVLFCKVSEKIQDSALSLALPTTLVSQTQPDWRRVNTFSPGVRHSPHHSFHGAVSQISGLPSAWEYHGMSADLKQKTALHILALWQHDDGYWLSGKYIQAFYNLDAQSLKTLPSLQNPLVEVQENETVKTFFFPNGKPLQRVHGRMDPSGNFMLHGLLEQWDSNGTRILCDHYENNELHGERFEWNRNGMLTRHSAFNHGEMCAPQLDALPPVEKK